MVARGFHLYAYGWDLRGGQSTVFPAARAAAQDLHAQGLNLTQQAAAADPDFIPASDGILRLLQTAGAQDMVPVELERIMIRHPNRGSLMRAMLFVSPQRGGRPDQVNPLCDRYAPMVHTIPAYTPQICAIDAVYFANFWDGPQRTAAQTALARTDNPVLDYARLQEATKGHGDPVARQHLLKATSAQRPLSPPEAWALDVARSENTGDQVVADLPEYKKALPGAIDRQRIIVERDPYNPDVVHD